MEKLLFPVDYASDEDQIPEKTNSSCFIDYFLFYLKFEVLLQLIHLANLGRLLDLSHSVFCCIDFCFDFMPCWRQVNILPEVKKRKFLV